MQLRLVIGTPDPNLIALCARSSPKLSTLITCEGSTVAEVQAEPVEMAMFLS